ncbi:esterase/lipase family protein [Streptomyces stackebrandtii]|uniref:esterase/lipase family protein n=1 Tax=Streptomyces stackebrandtii TaxID=3051177 RepID=UPI0028DC0F07|nr:alpha/beta fold hydrolase [Streptomyces sp. DSM 40976]
MEATDGQLGAVFIHGFGSSSSVWDPFLDLIQSDADLGFVTPLPFDYATSLISLNPLRRIPTFETIADDLKGFLDTEGEDFRDLALVSHSQGGLVIQRYLARMLADGRGRELSRIRRIVMFACPNAGSDFGKALRRGLPFNPQEQQLRSFNQPVADTQRIVVTRIDHATEITDSKCPIPITVYAGTQDNIVTPASAHGVFKDVGALPGDHSSIVRPDTHRHRSYTALKRLLKKAAEERPPPVDTLETVGAARLEVHPSVLPGESQSPNHLTPYLSRDHDAELHQILAPAIHNGASVLVILTGESSTGKTRSLYEALRELAPRNPLLRPHTAEDLLEYIGKGLVRPATVLWLNEAQRYFDGANGEKTAAELRALLEQQPGVAAVATMWTDPHWRTLTAQGVPGDPHGQARALLTGPSTRRIHVAAELSEQDIDRWAVLAQAQSEDHRLFNALVAGVRDGRVIQQLSGGPELLTAYLDGPGAFFTHGEHALITASLDARRFGHLTPIPAGLLAEAADGALAHHRHSPDPDWAEEALHALSTGTRTDGSRTDIRNTLTALTALRSRSGAAATYDPAEYLDQHIRALHADRRGSPSLWAALRTHTTEPDDLGRLFMTAKALGMRKQAVHIGCRVVLAGPSLAPAHIVGLLTGLVDPHEHGSTWIAAHADLTDGYCTARLLESLLEGGKEQALTILLNRDLVSKVDFTTSHSRRLLYVLQQAGANQVAVAAGNRIAAEADLTNPFDVGWLLKSLHELGAEEAVATLLNRDPVAQVDLTNPNDVAELLTALHEVGAQQAVTALLDRDPVAHANLTDPFHSSTLLRALQAADATQAVDALALRAATEADLSNTSDIAWLLKLLHKLDAEEAMATLINRDPVAQVDLTNPKDVAELLTTLHEVGAQQAVTALLDRDPVAHANLTDPFYSSTLLRALARVGAAKAFATAARRCAAEADLTVDRMFVTALVDVLRAAGVDQAVDVVSRRLQDPTRTALEPYDPCPYGREADGRDAMPWTWSDIPVPDHGATA